MLTGVEGEPQRPSGPRDLARRLGAWAGVVGPIVFVGTFTIEGWLRPEYDPTTMFVSALSLGSRGWVQIANFLMVGAAFLAFARGVAAQFPTGRASRAGPIVFAIVGLGLLGSGPFVMDPAGTQFPEMSLHGKVHQLLGAAVFSVGPASTFVLFRRFRIEPSWRAFARWTLAAGAVMTAGVLLLKVATLPPPASPNDLTRFVGVIQRVVIVTLMSWVASVGVAMLRRGKTPSEPAIDLRRDLATARLQEGEHDGHHREREQGNDDDEHHEDGAPAGGPDGAKRRAEAVHGLLLELKEILAIDPAVAEAQQRIDRCSR